MAVSYIDFVEEKLELGYHYGCVGGPQFKTDIVVNGAEVEQRNLNWWFPLSKWQLGERMLLDSDIEGIKEVEYLRSFHAARSGSKQGFRFKDWADYQVVGVELGTGDGVTTQWQLKKLYSAGEESFYRAITKPVEGTVKVYLDGNEITYHLINYETGLVSFAAPVSNGVVISADFEFDVPVSFEKDDIEWTLEAVRLETGETLHRLGSVMVEEMRIDLPIEWYHRDPIPYVITEPLNLGVILDTSESIQLSTESQSLSSGFKSKISTSEQTKSLIKLPSVTFTQEQLDKILAYFWVARGRLIEFLLQLNNQLFIARFDTDSLSIKFEADNSEDRLFEISNINFLSFGNNSILIEQDTYILPYIQALGAWTNKEIEAITNSLDILKKLIAFQFGEEYANKYFSYVRYPQFSDWLDYFVLEPSEEPTDNSSERKFLFLCFVNGGGSNSSNMYSGEGITEPSAFFLNDLNDFLAVYPSFISFRAVIYAQNVSQNYNHFANHLINALKGINGYTTALNQYNITARLNCSPTNSAGFYVKDLFSN